jgi:cupin superfamily acireductone dioxygenase involved in methionine salvage
MVKMMEDKERVVEKYQKDNEKIAQRLSNMEIAYDNLEITKASSLQKL